MPCWNLTWVMFQIFMYWCFIYSSVATAALSFRLSLSPSLSLSLLVSCSGLFMVGTVGVVCMWHLFMISFVLLFFFCNCFSPYLLYQIFLICFLKTDCVWCLFCGNAYAFWWIWQCWLLLMCLFFFFSAPPMNLQMVWSMPASCFYLRTSSVSLPVTMMALSIY